MITGYNISRANFIGTEVMNGIYFPHHRCFTKFKDFSATTCRQSRQDQVTNLRSCRCGMADITEVLVRRFNFMLHLQYRDATRPRSHVYAARPHAQRMQNKRASIVLCFSCLYIRHGLRVLESEDLEGLGCAGASKAAQRSAGPGRPEEGKVVQAEGVPNGVYSFGKYDLLWRAWREIRAVLPDGQYSDLERVAFLDNVATGTQSWVCCSQSDKQVRSQMPNHVFLVC
jgi:hypothetical protein